ncbi:MAG: hypothetical protein KAZ88_12715 [Acidimicrobiia bacterium]|nr:hypothetical protein [Acidimicrobiia bacterium]
MSSGFLGASRREQMNRRLVRRCGAAVLVFTLGFVAAGCGDDGDGSSDAATTTGPAQPTSTAAGAIDGAGSIDWTDLPYDEADVKPLPPEKSFIDAIDNSNLPVVAEVKVGQEITFRNRGRNSHNVIPEDTEAPWRIDLEDFQPGVEQVRVFDEPGLYRYYCSIHGTLNAGMVGAVLVTP